MSLEATIQENTAAILALIETLKSGTPTTAAQVAAVAPAGKPKATPAKTESAATTPAIAAPAAAPASTPSAGTPQSSPTTPAATASSAGAAEAPSYQDAATAITKLSRTKGRDTAVALLAKFGAANLKEVKPDQFAAVLAAANEAAGA